MGHGIFRDIVQSLGKGPVRVNEKIGEETPAFRDRAPSRGKPGKGPGVTPAGLWKVKTAGKRFLPPVTLEKIRQKISYNVQIFLFRYFLTEKKEFFSMGQNFFI